MLQFEPSSGTVPANGRAAIVATFSPRQERPLNTNVACVVKKKPARLGLNIKGEGYAIHAALQVQHHKTTQ